MPLETVFILVDNFMNDYLVRTWEESKREKG
jgi:hypothetical protein